MAIPTVESSIRPQDEVDLTDEQIQQLLLEAEGRLRGPSVQATKGTEDALFKYDDAACRDGFIVLRNSDLHIIRIPKLSSGAALEPYVRQGDEFAAANTAQLIDSKQRELSNSLHSLPDKRPNKVSFISRVVPSICYEENFPNA